MKNKISYSTVEKYSHLFNRFKKLATHQNDLKDFQRPWMVNEIINTVPNSYTLCEIGAGEPLAASELSNNGYSISICDPFDGSGNGPTEFAEYVKLYPLIKFIRNRFTPEVAQSNFPNGLDVIYSISVLEHVDIIDLKNLFLGIQSSLRPGGFSMHCIDIVLQGNGEEFHRNHLQEILHQQNIISNIDLPVNLISNQVKSLLENALADLDTYYLSPYGHMLWRGSLDIKEFPFRKVLSIQSVAQKPII
jgi:hypothetical protein